MKAISVTGIDACAATGSKKPLRARYCSEMLFFRFRKAPAGTSLGSEYFEGDTDSFAPKKPVLVVSGSNDLIGLTSIFTMSNVV